MLEDQWDRNEPPRRSEGEGPTPGARRCVEDCGLLAEPGDIYCSGCRSGVEARREAGAL